MHTDGQVGHDADLHANFARHQLCMLELLGDDPLAPLVEVNTIGELEALKLNTRRGGTSQVLGKLNRSLALNECTPQRVVGQLRAASLDEAIELALAMIRARGSEDNLKGLALSLPRAITVDQILTTSELACLVAKLLDSRARGLGQGRVFLDAGRYGEVSSGETGCEA